MWKLIWVMLHLTTLVVLVNSSKSECKITREQAIEYLKKPIYDFSVGFLDRVTIQKKGHFVLCPLGTWFQLVDLAEGANGASLVELWDVTGLKGYKKKSCYRRKLKEVFNEFGRNDKSELKISNVIIIDKYLQMNEYFKNEVELLDNTKVFSVNFDDAENGAEEANDFIEQKVNGELEDVVQPEDFNYSTLMMTFTAYFKSAWKHPFDKSNTKSMPFLSEEDIPLGNVNMMNQREELKYVEIERVIYTKVLELPCENERLSLLAFLPIIGNIRDFYYHLNRTTLTEVLKQLKEAPLQTVDVSIPTFEMETEVQNTRELLYDMGLRNVFYPDKAEFKRITEFNIDVSFMNQVSAMKMTEMDIQMQSRPASLINVKKPDVEFNANHAFAFMLVDKKTEIILFAGMYSHPWDLVS